MIPPNLRRDGYSSRTTRSRRKSKFARPYICLLIAFNRQTFPFDSAAAVGQGEAVADGVVVLDQAGGEASQMRDAALLGLGDPGVRMLALEVAQHTGEVTDQPVNGAQAVTALEDAVQAGLLVFSTVAGRGE
ncbi:hypothetical protein [Paractinoplanes hotanensis]|uniref:Uncharacterized protein n=1 Tax=Paractinoplanes hotanensis TaxID=2906497 RepID=A0ABT0XYM5_9ACTN|nr:hypothetical protein [Actinoplanes hotanensis]MCM4078720.1 hypothetical protein [Actinoplanes hotanensis]